MGLRDEIVVEASTSAAGELSALLSALAKAFSQLASVEDGSAPRRITVTVRGLPGSTRAWVSAAVTPPESRARSPELRCVDHLLDMSRISDSDPAAHSVEPLLVFPPEMIGRGSEAGHPAGRLLATTAETGSSAAAVVSIVKPPLSRMPRGLHAAVTSITAFGTAASIRVRMWKGRFVLTVLYAALVLFVCVAGAAVALSRTPVAEERFASQIVDEAIHASPMTPGTWEAAGVLGIPASPRADDLVSPTASLPLAVPGAARIERNGTKPSHTPTLLLAPLTFKGSLLVESQPSGAMVHLDQQPVGVTPILLSGVRASSHALRIEMAGFLRWTRAVSVATNERTKVLAVMDPDD